MAQDGPGTDAQPDAAETIPSGSGLRTTIILAGFIVLGVLTILYAQGIPPFTRTVQVTEQAEVRGETTIIAPRIDGYVTELLVEDFQRVSAGNILLRLEDSIYAQEVERARGNVQIALAALRNSEQGERAGKAGVSGAQARLEAAQAQLTQAQANMQRIEMLAGQGSISAWERDAAKADLVQSAAAVTEAEARVVAAEQQVEGVTVGRGGLLATVDAARAELRLAEINLANCVIRAPIDGQVSEVGARLGQYVTAGTALMGLVSEQMWVIANFREEQTARMRRGQFVEIRVPALDGARLAGRVEQLAPAAGNAFLESRPAGTGGDFGKVPQRIPVRIRLDPDQQMLERLRPGLSVEARVDTASAPAKL
ncbi:MAG: HlyD family secretion protein [Sphingomonadaceae bacterium]